MHGQSHGLHAWSRGVWVWDAHKGWREIDRTHTAGAASAAGAAFSAATAGRSEMPSAAPNMAAEAPLLSMPVDDMETAVAPVLTELVPTQGSGLGVKAAAPSTRDANETSFSILPIKQTELVLGGVIVLGVNSQSCV